MRALLIIALMVLPLSLRGQDTPPPSAVLVADSIFITRNRELVASGHVEAFQGQVRIKAQEIRYDPETGALKITGPITLRDGENVTILASAAELEPGLQNGLLTGARMVLNQQLQLAAVQINRVGGRYNQLYKTAVTSCDVCDDGRPPLWQIRARRVIHDQQEQQLYFDDAQFMIRNVPVFYIPRLRMPDPTLARATGFLIPSVRTTSQLGTGFKLPYFIKIGDHRDLTLTPYLSAKTTTLEYRYRQAFANGRTIFEGAFTRDDLLPGELRGYLFGAGVFDLKRDFVLSFVIEATSDDAYLLDYGYSSKDRLRNDITVSRTKRDQYIETSLIGFTSLREGEVNSTLPTIVADGVYEARYFPSAIGGEARLALNAHSHYRYSNDDILGRDRNRLNADVAWLRSWTLPMGVRAEATLGSSFDQFYTSQDSTVEQSQFQSNPRAAVTLRYPMSRQDAGGVTQILEPVVQLGWTGGNRLDLPNEESTRVEFDEGNLLSLSRFPSQDRRERGTAATVGISWARFDPKGWDAALTIGQVFRSDPDKEFSVSSGLSGASSDFLVAGQLKSEDGLALTARALFNESLDFSKAELRGDWFNARIQMGGSYLWLSEDPDEDRVANVSEVTLDGAYRINRSWTAKADWRFDLANDRAATAGIGMGYENECVSVDLSVKRRYTSSTSIEPSTSLGLSIELRGFSAQTGTENYSNSCGKKAR